MTKRPSHLEKMEIKEKHAERRAYLELKDKIEKRNNWLQDTNHKDKDIDWK